MKNIFALLVITLGISSAAQAGLLIEPYLGYGMGDVTYKYATAYGGGNEYTDKLTGTSYGLRLGYKVLFPWIALDYTGSSGTGQDGVPGNKDYSYTTSSLGAVVGVDLPFLIRAWAGYGISNEIDITKPNGGAKPTLTGGYTKMGVGFSFIPFLSINVEYQMNDIKKVNAGTGNGEQDKSAVFDTFSNSMTMISVSLPINL